MDERERKRMPVERESERENRGGEEERRKKEERSSRVWGGESFKAFE